MSETEEGKRQKAVALKYDPDKSVAPKVLAKGAGHTAQRILEMARQKDIPLYEDPELVEILSKLDVGLEIQPELYQAVAEVLIFIYRMNQKKIEEIHRTSVATHLLPSRS